jgi:hypothetical protein
LATISRAEFVAGMGLSETDKPIQTFKHYRARSPLVSIFPGTSYWNGKFASISQGISEDGSEHASTNRSPSAVGTMSLIPE